MSERFYDILVKKFDRSGHGVVNFDDFIQCCVVIQVGFALFFRYDESDKINKVQLTNLFSYHAPVGQSLDPEKKCDFPCSIFQSLCYYL